MFRRHALAVALAAICGQAQAEGFGASYFFGDSLSDAGSFAAFVPPGTGRFTTNPGPVWAERVAAALGTEAAPAVAGGTNYAQGGARVSRLPGVPDTSPLTAAAMPVSDQVAAYLAPSGRAQSGALHSLWAGANDVFVAIDPARPEAANPAGNVIASAAELAGLAASLQAAGARYIVVANVPDIGATPFGASLGAAGAGGLTALSSLYNQTLFGNLAAAQVRVIPLDTFALLREVSADPARYGFVNVSIPACGATPSLVCTQAALVAPGADQNFLFADGVHPSSGGHAVIADYALSVLRAPGAISLLAESPLQTRETFVAGVQAREGRPGAGPAAWASLSGGQLEYDAGHLTTGAEGTPYAVSAGADVALTPALVLGAAVGIGTLDADFSRDAGGYEQDEQTVALYATFGTGPFRASAVAAAGALDYDVSRRVVLGDARRTMRGSTSGSNLSLAIEAAYAFASGALSHGPFAALHLQRVDVDGFRERGNSSTTMAFRGQDRDAVFASLGYQARWQGGRCEPYVKVGVTHDYGDHERNVGANLVSLSANAFALPAFAGERTWATLIAGVGMKVGAAARANLALSARGMGNDAQGYALQAGLSLGF